MACEVVVVGGGIGGLTVAALLAKRGVDVCLLEREPQVGGCATNFEKFGYSFEPGYGLFTGWKPDEIHALLFAELGIEAPETRLCVPSYLVRLPDQAELALVNDNERFEENLCKTFPECATGAVAFYRGIATLGTTLRRVLQRSPDLLSMSNSRRALSLVPEGRIAAAILKASQRSTADYLGEVSLRFRRFVDVQLQTLTQASSLEVPYLHAALALNAPREGMFAMRGGAAELAKRLAQSIYGNGGRIRLDTPVLRLSYNSEGDASGVDLLSGETVTAARAVVSNLTVWDTYGKLAGLNHTPLEIRRQLNKQKGWGAYLLLLGMEEDASLVADHILALTDWQDGRPYDSTAAQLMFAAAPSWDPRAPAGKRAVTVHAFTDVDDWFTFHKDETELEEKDQEMLEQCWLRLHAALPELGDSVEVIETANPRTFYEQTRRKLGMVGSLPPTPLSFWLDGPAYATSIKNLFIVGDTTYPFGIEGLTRSALLLADKLTA
jgi:phytoene dehydrogenase-like protein